MAEELEKLVGVLPTQYVGKWKNDEGTVLYIPSFFDPSDNSLLKLFIPRADYISMKIKKFLSKDVQISILRDDEDRPVLMAIESRETANA